MKKIEKQEIARKIIHLFSLVYPIAYMQLDKNVMLFVVGSITFLLILLETVRLLNPAVNTFLCKMFAFTMRHKEKQQVSGATYFMVGVFLTILLFSPPIAVIALFVLIISDTLASILGIIFAKKKWLGGKSKVGFAAFLISSLVIAYISSYYTPFSFFNLCVAALVASLLEIFSAVLKYDDNLVIPLGYGGTLFILNLLV